MYYEEHDNTGAEPVKEKDLKQMHDNINDTKNI